MNGRINLYVLGISSSQLQSGAYALVLAEENGLRRIPVVIGATEAQSIAVSLEGIHTPRPLTHDLFVTFAHAFGVRLKEVFIYRFEDGIFYSQLTFSDEDGRTVVVDARTSDAVAIAIRTGTPIQTTEEIMRQTGFVIDDDSVIRANRANESNETDEREDADEKANPIRDSGYHSEPKLENYTIEELERTLSNLIEREDYETAARVNEILKRKRGENNNEI